MRVLYVYIGLFIIGCSPKKPTEVNETEQELVTEKKVFFKWPKNGATVASPVFIDMGVEGMVVEPAGVVKDGFGHHHILIDQKFWPQGEVIPMSDTTLHFGKGETDASIELEPGQYLISLQFADGVHASFGESMSSSILINVE